MRQFSSLLVVAAGVVATGSLALAADRLSSKAEIGGWGVRADHVATPTSSASESTFTLDINMAGWVANGDFTDPTNTSVTANLIPNAYITGLEWINLNFDSINGSWRSELALSTNQSTNTGAAGTFWDHRPAPSLGSSGNYTGSGAFTAPSNQFVSGPFQVLADGQLLVYVYDTFDDAGTDEQINSGTLRVTYSDVAPPPPPAPTLLYTGDLATTDTIFNRPVSLSALSGVGTAVYEDATAFTVSATGSYTIEQRSTAIDSYLMLYSPSFSPGSALTNLIALDDDGGATGGDSQFTVSLTAGVTYYLVNSSFDNGEVGNYDVYYTGAGTILVPEPMSIAGLMGVGVLLRRRRVA